MKVDKYIPEYLSNESHCLCETGSLKNNMYLLGKHIKPVVNLLQRISTSLKTKINEYLQQMVKMKIATLFTLFAERTY